MPAVGFGEILGIALFGALGVLSRFGASLAVAKYWAPTLPVGTFLINIVGSFLIGLVLAIDLKGGLITFDLRTMLTVGFLGGFTTFSSFSFETYQLFAAGRIGWALAYGLGSPVLGMTVAGLGYCLGR